MATESRRVRQPRIIRTFAVWTVLVALLGLAGCAAGQPSPQATSVEPRRTLVIGATAEPTSLDPTADAAAAGSQAMLYNVYETLLKTDAEGQLKPLLARSWELSADRTTYTFHLNQAAKFADGTPVTADAVAQNIVRIRDTGVAAKLKNQMAIVASTRSVDQHTLEVALTRPSNTWLYEMSSTAGMVMNPTGFTTLGTATFGSGPLRLKQWNPGESIVLEKNPAYWGTPVRFDEVVFRYFADPNAMNAAMLSDQLDIISNLQAPDALAQFADPARFTVLEGTTNGEVVLGLNNTSPALKDPRVRQAVSKAIDKRALVDTVWNGKGTLIGSMVVPTDPYFEDLTGISAYDPAAARALLAEAGYGSGLTLRLKPAALPYASKAAQFVASQLGEVGVTVTIEELQFPARWLDTVYNQADYDMTIVAHVEARDISTFANPNYYWRYDNPAFSGLIASADEAAPEEYVSGMKAAARLLAEDAAAVWLFSLPNLVITRPEITGVGENMSSLSFDVTTIATA